MSDQKQWSDRTILKAVNNPSEHGYEIEISTTEFTICGVSGQPDFADVLITFVPGELVIELKSLKEYFYQFRSAVISYERLINVIYEDLWETYHPNHLQITLKFNPRGGLSSTLKIDSANRILFERTEPEEIPPGKNSDHYSQR